MKRAGAFPEGNASGPFVGGAACRSAVTRLRGSGGGVLELLQRTHLDLDRGGLGGEPLLFLGEGVDALAARLGRHRSEEQTSELQSLMRISYAVFCLKTKKHKT